MPSVSAISVSGRPEVVMQDEDRPLLDGQASERPVERIAVVDREERIRSRRPVDRQDTDVRRPLAPTPGLGVARVDEQAPDPGFEAIRVTQGRELAPDGDEGALQGILGEDRCRAGSARRARTSGRWSCGPAPRTHRDRRSGPGRRDLAPSLPRSTATVVAPSHPMRVRSARNVQAVRLRLTPRGPRRLGSGSGRCAACAGLPEGWRTRE